MLSLTMRLFLKKRPSGKVKSDNVDKGQNSKQLQKRMCVACEYAVQRLSK